MPEYVSKITLDINGQQITNFKSATEKEVELGKEVPLMNETGFIDKTPRYGVALEYIIPKDTPEFDFTTVKNGRLTIDRGGNAGRITYTGVTRLKIGESKYDGENEVTKTIDFGATDRIPE